MGRRERGDDHIGLQRRGEKKRRAAFKRLQTDVTKQLRDKINDPNATSASIQVELDKLNAFKQLNPEQRKLRDDLNEKLTAVRELDRLKEEFAEQERQRKIDHPSNNDSSDDSSSDFSSSSDDDNDDDNNNVGPSKPPAFSVALAEDDPWAAFLAADIDEKKKQQQQPTNRFAPQSSSTAQKQNTKSVSGFVPLSRMMKPAGATTVQQQPVKPQQQQNKTDETDAVDDAEFAAFLAKINQIGNDDDE